MTLSRRRLSQSPAIRRAVLAFACIFLLFLSQREGLPARRDAHDLHLTARLVRTIPRAPARGPDVVRHAIFVQVSKETLTHLPRLLNRIWHPDNVYAVHFDVLISPSAAHRALLHANLTSAADSIPSNVLTMPQETVNYRGVSMLLNTISAMQFLLDADRGWRYFINLSASDYPLVSPSFLRELLGHPGRSRNFFSFSSPQKAERMLRARMTEFHVDDALTFRRGKRPVTTVHALNPVSERLGFAPSYSEAWMINSRQFCRYVVSSPVARKTLLTFAYSLSSPEHYFATLARNDRMLNASVVAHSMRHIVWKFRGQAAQQHPFYLDELPGMEREIRQSPLLFARKFRRPDSNIKDVIDAFREDAAHERTVREHFYMKIDLPPPRMRQL